MVNIVACTIEGAGIGDTKALFKRQRYPHKVCALCDRPCPGKRIWKEVFGNKCRICEFLLGIDGILGGRFPDYEIRAIHLVVPGTTVPVVGPLEVENARALHVKRDVEFV